MSWKKIQRNEKKDYSLLIVARNKFVLYSCEIKGMGRNENEKLFLINGKKN